MSNCSKLFAAYWLHRAPTQNPLSLRNSLGCLGPGACPLPRRAVGFDYLGLDISKAAIRSARAQSERTTVRFLQADFFHWSTNSSFDVIYDKGLFHGLAGVRRRNAFLCRVAAALRPEGIWITVCGSADHRRSDFCHGAIYLRDLVAPAEIYFEILEIVKTPYGLADQEHDFEAWHAAFRRR